MTQPPIVPFSYAPNLAHLLGSADEIASASGSFDLGTEHILLAMMRDPSTIPTDKLRALGMDSCILLTRLAECALPARLGIEDSGR
ncbi:MAG: hypothetical protein JWN03_5858 [Nocardia sp.]|uniref:Clp protease N-terminal domain-containing protein n=1 Tax=Nocardia sp. TaxID=1821 RepID=UPI00263142C8|nr:Clp protease N-terminal domain-containing protein [Nocardia sp.]MCU1645583.1 hypothetical protein [Nocardia sp.]